MLENPVYRRLLHLLEVYVPIYMLLERQHVRKNGCWLPEDTLLTCFEAVDDNDADQKKQLYLKNAIGETFLFALEARQLPKGK